MTVVSREASKQACFHHKEQEDASQGVWRCLQSFEAGSQVTRLELHFFQTLQTSQLNVFGPACLYLLCLSICNLQYIQIQQRISCLNITNGGCSIITSFKQRKINREMKPAWVLDMNKLNNNAISTFFLWKKSIFLGSSTVIRHKK